MKPYCVMDDRVARLAVNIPIALENIGISRVFAMNTACDWLKIQCNIPLLIAHEVYHCLAEHHTACSQGNKVCELHPHLCNRNVKK